MPATTETLIDEAFTTAIRAITPRMQDGRTTRVWKLCPTGDAKQPVRSDSRWFWLEWDNEGYTPGGFMGPAQVDTTSTLSIFVDYGGIPERLVKRLATDDHYQIRDVLNLLKSTVDGLRWVEAIDWDFASNNTDRNQARIVHQYEVRYMKARA